jgi:phosphoribosylanthranilate isomerase
MMKPVKLKVCGVTSLPDARGAIEAGASYLGFNFYRRSPRYIDPEAARAIIDALPEAITPVGIFVNEERPADVDGILRASGARLAQLHGDEDAGYCAEVGAARVIKALRVGESFEPTSVRDYPAAAILLDAWDEALRGGTGKTIDWELARAAARLSPVFLAGGLNPSNVEAAIRAVEPYGVDINSGVESAPGRKDPQQLQRLRVAIQSLGGKAQSE